MRRTIYVLSLAALLSFLVGLWYELERTGRSPLRQRDMVRAHVLAPRGVFNQEFVESLKAEENIDIILTEAPSTKALLSEILKSHSPYEVIVFPSFLSDSLAYSEYFMPLNEAFGRRELRSLVEEISVDFLSLGKDPENRYTLPVLWGVNGWLIPEGMTQDRLSLSDLLLRGDSKTTLHLLAEPIEFFGVLAKLRPSLKTWVGTGNAEEFQTEVQSLQGRLKVIPESAPPTAWRQIPSGSLDRTTRERFRLADEKSHLWIQFLALRRGAAIDDNVKDLFKVLYSSKWSEKLAMTSKMAHCGRRINRSSKVGENLKSSFIRQLPISRLELISAHEAYEPLFLGYLKGQYQSGFPQ
jgi:hypothetical protein